MKKVLIILVISGLSAVVYGQDTGVPGPSFKEVLSLKSAGGPAISPDGKMVLYTIRKTEWEKNGYDTEIWLAKDGKEPFQLTWTKNGSSSSHAWSPDGKWISFIANRGDKRQVYLISPNGGEAFKYTTHKEGINSYRWSPDGKKIAFTSTEPRSEEMKSREKMYGRFEVEDAEYRVTHLWVIDVDIDDPAEAERLTEGGDMTVGGYNWSPDSRKIAFDFRPDPLINSFIHTDISIIDVSTKSITPLVAQPGSDSWPIWSPDGEWILFGTKIGDNRYYTNGELARIKASGGDIEVITEGFDENLSVQKWTRKGIYCLASQTVFRNLFLLDPETGTVELIADSPENINSVSFADDEKTIAISGYSRETMSEIYKTDITRFDPVRITEITDQVADWKTGTREIITWKSKDGAKIDGVLWKPDGFDPNSKYPLMVIIHGGPSSTSRPVLVSNYVYPQQQWLEKGAIILQPNYRGSAGYGEKFRSLNVKNLGVGDMWDVESGVDYLIKEGIADPERVGAMGWSQGGYISAFLTTNSKKFKAVSVGAGISNWVTYYVNTDIHPFTRHYLQATPWDDMKIYEKTSPMTNIKKSKTPTLIQHGEFDRRVPIPNAYELFQGLQDVGVETKLIVYKDFGHGITRPKERLAAVWHNWQWFAKYIWNEEVEIPIELEKEKDKK